MEGQISAIRVENDTFVTQLHEEQENDCVISLAKECVSNNVPMKEVQLKKYEKQLVIKYG